MPEDVNVLLAKIDERTKNIERDYNDLKGEIKSLREEIKENYVNIHQFNPIQRVVFAAISVVLLGVLAAIINLVIPKG